MLHRIAQNIAQSRKESHRRTVYDTRCEPFLLTSVRSFVALATDLFDVHQCAAAIVCALWFAFARTVAGMSALFRAHCNWPKCDKSEDESNMIFFLSIPQPSGRTIVGRRLRLELSWASLEWCQVSGYVLCGFSCGFCAEDIRREVEACSRKRNSATLQYCASNRSSYAPSLPEWMGKVMVE